MMSEFIMLNDINNLRYKIDIKSNNSADEEIGKEVKILFYWLLPESKWIAKLLLEKGTYADSSARNLPAPFRVLEQSLRNCEKSFEKSFLDKLDNWPVNNRNIRVDSSVHYTKHCLKVSKNPKIISRFSKWYFSMVLIWM